jgi:hypothetical protein
MEYPLSQLDQAVYFTLTLNPNSRFSLDELSSEICSNRTCPDFACKYFCRIERLANACLSASTTWNNVCFNGTHCYLKIDDKYDMLEIEKIIRSPHLHTELSLDIPYCSGQTIPHILCIEGNTCLLDELSKSFQINVMSKNEKGQTLLDVIPNEKHETMKTLIRIAINQMRDAQNTAILEIKSKNTDLLKANSLMRNELISLHNYKTQMDSRILFLYFSFAFITAVISGLCYVVLK